MSYATCFYGKFDIELQETYVNKLREYIKNELPNTCTVMVDTNFLTVNDEWKDRGLMEEITLFIESHGKLISGTICCEGEDLKDVWEIVIKENKPFIRELGTVMTLSRITSKLNTLT